MGEIIKVNQVIIFVEQGDFNLTSPYGYRYDPFFKDWRGHKGADGNLWKGWASGCTICSPADGVVIKEERNVNLIANTPELVKIAESQGITAGNYIDIQHGNGKFTRYQHLAYGGNKVKVGDRVTKRQPIAVMGTTGKSTGTHIHFEVYTLDKNGNKAHEDPMPYIKGEKIIENLSEVVDDMGYIEIKKTLKHRDRGEEVKLLQMRFTQLSKEFEAEVKKHSFKATGEPDGGYGDGMKLSVIKFQKMCGLPETGNVDEPTRQMLNATPWDMQERIRQLLLEKASVQAEKTALQSEMAKKDDKIVKAKTALNDILKSI